MRLFNEDCILSMDRLISEGVRVDLIVTDPPYEVTKSKKPTKSSFSKNLMDTTIELEELGITEGFDYEGVLNRLVQLQDNINMYIWCNKSQIPFYLDYFVTQRDCKFEILNWYKTNPVPTFNNKYMGDKEICLYFRKGGYCNPQSYKDGSTLFLDPINKKDKKLYGNHPTIKYEHHIERLIRNSSKEGDVVLDCFMGTGSVGTVSKKLGREFIGMELSEKYFDIRKNRIDNTCINEVHFDSSYSTVKVG